MVYSCDERVHRDKRARCYDKTVARVYTSKTRGLRIATRCATVEQFVAAFYRTCDEKTFFVSTLATRPVGLETSFSVDLAGGTPVLRGIGVVLAAWPTTKNPFGRPGVQLGIRRLTADSERVHEQLMIARALEKDATHGVPIPIRGDAAKRPPRSPLRTDKLAIVQPRTPGADFVLPANPLMNLSDESLEGFIDCTLYEDPGAQSEPHGRRWWWPFTALRVTLRRLARG